MEKIFIIELNNNYTKAYSNHPILNNKQEVNDYVFNCTESFISEINGISIQNVAYILEGQKVSCPCKVVSYLMKNI